MKSVTKRTGAIMAAAALATTLATTGVLLLKNGEDVAVAAENEGIAYYYNKLGNDQNAKNFYNAFKTLTENETLKTGKVEYDIVANAVMSASDVQSYVNGGNKRVVEAYSAGRDSFFLDNPDLFYVDLFGTSISAGTMGNKYVAYLDSSRVSNLYKGDLNTPEKVNDAISEYEKALKVIVDGANTQEGVIEKIKYVNNYIVDHTEYSFGTIVEDNRNIDTPAAAYIYTAYGALVNGKAVCEGYSNAFKAVMDRLDIPCVSIHGYHLRDDGTNVAHSWNAVNVEGNWYAVDVTFNDTESGNNKEKWLFMGSEEFNATHLEDNSVSSSGFELQAPALSPYAYGVTEDKNGMYVASEYEDRKADSGEVFKVMRLTVSQENKGGLKLQEEGKYLAFRYGDVQDGKLVWLTNWMGAVAYNELAPAWLFTDTQSTMILYPGVNYIQIAVMNRAPDSSNGATYPDSAGENAGKPCYYVYSNDTFTNNDFYILPSAAIQNDGHNSYVPAPFGFSDLNTGDLPVDGTYEIEITYTESLEKIDTNEDVTMEFTCSRNDSTVRQHATLTDFQWDGDKVVTFTFTPSKMYEHLFSGYNFTPSNLQGVSSKKVPSPVRFAFKAKQVICSRVFNDGRQYMLVYGQPEILDTSDISVTDFKDENGNYYAESQRSQLVLVTKKPDESKQKELDDTLLSETELKKDEILASASYEIDLQICGCVTKVPNGSYMQVKVGFPDGYGPENEGVTFMFYHYKHDDAGNITGVEEIPAIITQYGLIARVTSFSPFTVVAVKTSSKAVSNSQKAVYASVTGNGSLSTATGSGISLVEGDSITYTVSANEGYQVSYILLNGTKLDASRYADGTLTLSAAELEQGNILEAAFVTAESAQSYAEKGVSIAAVGTGTVGITPTASANGMSAGVIAAIVVISLVVAGAVVALAIVLVKNRKHKA